MQKYYLCSAVSVMAMMAWGQALAQPAQSSASTPSTSVAPSTSGAALEPKTDTAAADAAPQTPSNQLGEIIVTAQRRTENLQRAAIPVDVISAQDVLKGGVSEPTALGTLAPALTATPSGGARVNFFVRGVGNFTQNPLFESAIAFNYDGVYIGRPGSTSGFFYDLERIEVLKGPQGTLYGRNATGGAINVIPVKPKLDDFSGYVTGSYGNYNAVNVEGAVNVPIGEHGAVRISGNSVNHNAYLNDGTSDEDTRALRVQTLAELTPSLTVRVSADYAHVGGLGVGASYVSRYQYNFLANQYVTTPSGLSPAVGLYSPQGQAFRQTLFGEPAARLLDQQAPPQFQNNSYYGVNGEITYSAPAGTLTIIPAWRYSRQHNLTDSNGFIAEIATKDDQYSVEARFAGKPIGPIDYTAGAYYFHENHTGNDSVAQSTLVNYETNIALHTRSLATFARLTAHLSDKFRVVGAVRYTNDRKTFSGDGEGLTIVCLPTGEGPPSCPNAPLFPFVPTLQQLPFAFIPPPGGAIPLFGTGALLVRSPSIIANNEVQTKGRVTYRAAVEYDVAPRSLVYASVETGFRSGGFNLVNGYETYSPEYITAYTVGSKNRFLDNRLQLNVEGYLWKYRDQQLAHIGIDKAGRQGLFVQNIGQPTIYGVDVDGKFLATPTTILTGQVQYLHSKYDRYSYQVPASAVPPYTSCANAPDATNPGLVDINCAGKPGYNSPRWTLNLGADQTISMGDYKFVASVDTQYRTGRYVGFDYVASEYTDPTWQTNAQLTFAPKNDNWSISGFVRNIENDRYKLTAVSFLIASTVVANTAPPRTYGIRGSFKF